MDTIKRINYTYNLDCFEGFKLLEPNSIDTVFTSLPYNRKRNDKYANYNDSVDWLSLLNRTLENSYRVLKPNGYVFFNIQKNYYNKVDYYKFLGQHAKEIVQTIVWGKTNPMPASGKNITNSYEVFVVLNQKGKSLKAQHTYTKNIFFTNVNSNNKYSKIHKAVMNIDACRKVFGNFIGNNKLVLDPFMGVGTTGVVCQEFDCPYLGFEIDKEYADISNQRVKETV